MIERRPELTCSTTSPSGLPPIRADPTGDHLFDFGFRWLGEN
jgi:hypothetical protein